MKDVVERLGAVGIDAESVALGNGDGPRVNPSAGMGSGRGGWNVAAAGSRWRRRAGSGPSSPCTRIPPVVQRGGCCACGRRGRPPRRSGDQAAVGRSCVADHLQADPTGCRRLRARRDGGRAGCCPAVAASSPGEASPTTRRSTRASRIGSPSAAKTAARASRSWAMFASIGIESMLLRYVRRQHQRPRNVAPAAGGADGHRLLVTVVVGSVLRQPDCRRQMVVCSCWKTARRRCSGWRC